MLWKKIKKIEFKNVDECLKKLKKKSFLSPWIIDIFNKRKKVSYKKYQNLEIHRITVKNLGFTKPTILRKIYKTLKKKNYLLVNPELALYLRIIYKKQPTGEWLRIAVPFKSMIDSDGVPHLPKLGRALKKNFLETYWSYPKAVFHPHNDFLVIKKKK
tara:strand:- start:639 stop:1112 length:474 start_codon:yes stop_codon:yes gene_type:complete